MWLKPPSWGGDKQSEAVAVRERAGFRVEKDRLRIVNIDLPNKNGTCILPNLLWKATDTAPVQDVTNLGAAVTISQTVTIDRLATVFPQPIKFESRRRSLQRFLSVPQLSIQFLWFPVLKRWVRISFLKKGKRLTLAIDRTQWRDQNVCHQFNWG